MRRSITSARQRVLVEIAGATADVHRRGGGIRDCYEAEISLATRSLVANGSWRRQRRTAVPVTSEGTAQRDGPSQSVALARLRCRVEVRDLASVGRPYYSLRRAAGL